jgi:hypothetical protein
LHTICAKQGHAPEILDFGQFPWNTFATHAPSVPSRLPNLTRLLAKWIGDLHKLVQSFHNEGLVRGDLQEPYILCDGEKVMLIVFDWVGVVGEAYYPHALF